MVALGLGTAQLGLPYGPYAHEELMPVSKAHKILLTALENNITFIDTALAYGESEKRIGEFLSSSPMASKAVICTKVPRAEDATWKDPKKFKTFIAESFAQSSQNISFPVSYLLLHQCEVEFLSTPHVNEAFKEFAKAHPSIKLGVSIYTMEEALLCLTLPWVKVLQCPANLVDQRFLERSFIDQCKEKGIFLIIRSAFLQGVLTENSPIPAVKKQPELSKLREDLKKSITDRSLEEAALAFLFQNHRDNIDVVILGIHSSEEVEHNVEMLEKVQPLSNDQLAKISLISSLCQKHLLHDPREWNK